MVQCERYKAFSAHCGQKTAVPHDHTLIDNRSYPTTVQCKCPCSETSLGTSWKVLILSFPATALYGFPQPQVEKLSVVPSSSPILNKTDSEPDELDPLEQITL